MGLSLSEPVTVKETQRCASKKFKGGSSSMQGWRLNMEDAHQHTPEVPDNPKCGYFAIFDGHGGSEVSTYANKYMMNFLFSQPDMLQGDIPKALKLSLTNLDNNLKTIVPSNVGSTANIVVISGDKMYCANVGDTRVVVSISGMAKEMSEDHKPQSDAELHRIVRAGGFVTNYRVNGSLALSRALGDFLYKENPSLPPEQQMVIAVPDITVVTITPKFEFFVMACDGIWDVMTSQEVVNFVRLRIANQIPPELICEELMTNCLAPDIMMGGLGCDNMTAMIICFVEGSTYEDLAQKCKVPSECYTHPPLPPATKLITTPGSANSVSQARTSNEESVITIMPSGEYLDV